MPWRILGGETASKDTLAPAAGFLGVRIEKHWQDEAVHSENCAEFAKEVGFEVEWGPCGAMSRLELPGGRSNGHTDTVRKASEWKVGEPVDSERESETQRYRPAERKWIMLTGRVLPEDQGLLHLSPSIVLPSTTFSFNSPWAWLWYHSCPSYILGPLKLGRWGRPVSSFLKQ